jgi:hypothetical protein
MPHVETTWRRCVFISRSRSSGAAVPGRAGSGATPRCERALRERIAQAETLRDYDWEAGEAEFARFVRRAVGVPGVYERWRAHGVPIRVLLSAGLRPDR